MANQQETDEFPDREPKKSQDRRWLRYILILFAFCFFAAIWLFLFQQAKEVYCATFGGCPEKFEEGTQSFDTLLAAANNGDIEAQRALGRQYIERARQTHDRADTVSAIMWMYVMAGEGDQHLQSSLSFIEKSASQGIRTRDWGDLGELKEGKTQAEEWLKNHKEPE